MMELSQIFIWVTVGLLLAIGAGLVFARIQRFRRRFEEKNYPPAFSVETALNEQNAFVRREMKAQADNAAEVKTALEQQQTTVKTALEQQQTDVKEVLSRQQTEVKDTLTEQQETVRQDFAAQSEIIEALTNYQSATKSDLVRETEIVKTAVADTVKTKTRDVGEKSK